MYSLLKHLEEDPLHPDNVSQVALILIICLSYFSAKFLDKYYFAVIVSPGVIGNILSFLVGVILSSELLLLFFR